MGNPILEKLTQTMPGLQNNPISGFVNMARMLKGANNPQGMFENMMAQNPKIKEAMNIAQKYGNTPRDAFYALAREKGVDPDEFLKQFQ